MGKQLVKFSIAVVVIVTTMLTAAYSIYLQTDAESIQNINRIDLLIPLLLLIGCIIALAVVLYWFFIEKNKQRWLTVIRRINKDKLTGLPNQQRLLKDLEGTQHTNLAFIKFHHYNSILNTYGPAVTEDVVRQVAAVINQFDHPMMQKASCYYLNAGVFAILEDQDTTYERIETITKALVVKILTTQYQVGDGEYISLNVTVGAVRQNTEAFMLANMALQQAEAKKLQFYLIDKEHSILPETYRKELAITQKLLQGIKERRIVAYFQPILSAKNRSVQKYECLARLVNEQGEIEMMPNVFLPLAHRANVYYLITKAMIKHAIDFAIKHQLVVSINYGISDINNKRTCEYLFKKLKHSQAGHLLHFELLENEVITKQATIVAFIDKLHELGCQVGMDDLGKGYSNIERLINLPIDFVKIDRTIMEHVAVNTEMQNLAKGIIDLAHKKGLEVVAEYCSNQKLTDVAVELGVDFLQGYYLGKPNPDILAQSS